MERVKAFPARSATPLNFLEYSPYIVVHLDFILYEFLNNSLLNKWTRNSFLRSYLIIVGPRYLHNHFCYSRFAMVDACYIFLDFTIGSLITVH